MQSALLVNGGSQDIPSNAPSGGYIAATDTTSFVATGAQVTGGGSTQVLALTGAMGADSAVTLPAVADVLPRLASPSYVLRVVNESSVNHVWTVAAGTGWTVVGTATIAQNTWREFLVTVTSPTAATAQNIGTGTFS